MRLHQRLLEILITSPNKELKLKRITTCSLQAETGYSSFKYTASCCATNVYEFSYFVDLDVPCLSNQVMTVESDLANWLMWNEETILQHFSGELVKLLLYTGPL